MTQAGSHKIHVSHLPYSGGLTATYYTDTSSLNPTSASHSSLHTGSIDFSAQTQGTSQSLWASLSSGTPFAVRWSGFMRVPIAAVYTTTFGVRTASERVRLWVDNALVLDQWVSLSSMAPSGTYNFGVLGGYYDVRAEYKQHVSNSAYGATLSWETSVFTSDGEPITRSPIPSERLYAPRVLSSVFEESVLGGLHATAYMFVDLTEPRGWEHMDSIDFSRESGAESALPGIASAALGTGLAASNNNDVVNTMSVRWSGYVRPQYAQAYTFTAVLKEADERVRIWVDDTLIVDQWSSLSSLSPQGYATFACPAGNVDHAFRIHYSDRSGARGLRLLWSTQGEGVVRRELIPSDRLAIHVTASPAPYNVVVRPDVLCASRSYARGSGLSLATAGADSTFVLVFRDRFDNTLSTDGQSSADNDGVVAIRQVSAAYVPPSGAPLPVLRTHASARRGQAGLTSSIGAVTRAGTHKMYISGAMTGGLSATYYSDVSSTPASAIKATSMTTTTDALIDPAVTACLTSSETFSARWAGFLTPLAGASGVYTMQASVADVRERVRMWLDNALIIDQWASLTNLSPAGTVDLTSDVQYDVRLDYQRDGSAQGSVQLTWATPVSTGIHTPISVQQLAFESAFSGYPSDVLVLPSVACGTKSRGSGSGLTIATVGEAAAFTITAYDAYSNLRTTGGDQFIVQGMSPIVNENAYSTGQSDYTSGVVTDQGNGTYAVVYPASAQAGVYSVLAHLAMPGGLLATYYDDTDTADPKAMRIETGVQVLTFGSNRPIQALSNANTYSVRWSGYVSHAYAETYTYALQLGQVTERARLWVDNSLIIDQWESLSSLTLSATVAVSSTLRARLAPIEIAYQHQYGDAFAELRWKSASQNLAPPSSERLYQAYSLQGFPSRSLSKSSTPCAAASRATGAGLTLTQVCMSASFTIRARDHLGNQLSSDLAQVFVRLTSWEVNGASLPPFDGTFSDVGTVAYVPISTYTVNYQPLGTSNVLSRVSFVGKNGLAATYYNGITLDPTQAVSSWPAHGQEDQYTPSMLEYNASSTTQRPPNAGSIASAESFSVRWQGLIRPDQASNYTIFFGLGSRQETDALNNLVTRTDERVKVWLDNHLLIDQWSSLASTSPSATLSFPTVRMYDIRVEYRNWKDKYAWSLRWSSCGNRTCDLSSSVAVPSGVC